MATAVMESPRILTTGTKRRRASKLDDSDDSNSKRRGRPRVEKPDESAADRRRTQIRMAQRAYRQRKESTLDELRKRVADLANVAESMNEVFMGLKDHLIDADLPEASILECRLATSRFTNLMKIVHQAEESSSGGPESVELKASAAPTTPVHMTSDVLVPKNVSGWLDQNEVARPRRTGKNDYLGMGYSVVLPEDFTYTDPLRSRNRKSATSVQDGAADLQNLFKLPKAEVPQLGLTSADLPATTTVYSFQETSFARRLHRACIEAGFHILSDPARRPHIYERIYKLSLLSHDKSKLIAGMKDILSRGPHEPLDLWGAPLIHVGGAGTHYARRDKDGNMLPRKSSYHLGKIGPQTLALLVQADEQGLTSDMTVEIAGFEGEWFDPYDVEGFLNEKGIFIDPGSSFTEAVITETPHSPESSSTVSSASPLTPPLNVAAKENASGWNSEQWKDPNFFDVDVHSWNESSDLALGGLGNVGWTDTATESWMNFPQPETLPTTRLENIPTKKAVIIDVAKLIDNLMVNGLCLGRTPGFKKADVEKALANASFDPV